MTGRVQEGVQFVDSNGRKAAGFVQNYDVAVENAVPAAVDYRVGVRSVLTDTSLARDDDAAIVPTSTVEPSVDLAWRNPVFTVEAGASGLASRQDLRGEEDTDFTRTSLYSRVTWNPIGLPSWRIGVEQTSFETGSRDRSDETEWEVQMNHEFGPFRFHYAGTFETLDDEGGATRTTDEHIGRIDYQQELDEFGTNLAAGLLYDTSVTRARFEADSAGPPLVAVAGLFAIDTTPTVGTLDERASLVDGDVTTGTGINIGSAISGGGTDRNLGLDFGIDVAVEEIRVTTDVAVNSTDAVFYEWSVYSSDDNRTWRLVTGSAGFVYDFFMRRFEIRFGPVTTRYVKVVNTQVAPASGAIFVTEIGAFGDEAGGGTRKTTRDLATAHLSYRMIPFEGFDVTATVLVGTTQQEDGDTETRDEERVNLGLSARYQPALDWDVTVSGSTDRYRDPVTTDRVRDSVSGLVSYRPWDGLETSLTANHRVDTEDGDLDFKATSVGARVGAEIDPDLSTSVDVTRTEAEDPDADNETEQWSVSTLVFAKLTRELQLNFDGRWDEVEVTGNADLANPTQIILSPELIYRPGPSVLASGDVEYRTGDAETGLFHRYRLDWLPFPDGNLNVELNYTLEVLPQAGSGTRQGLLARIVWNLTNRSYFELLGSDQRTTSGDGNRAQSLLFTYNYSF